MLKLLRRYSKPATAWKLKVSPSAKQGAAEKKSIGGDVVFRTERQTSERYGHAETASNTKRHKEANLNNPKTWSENYRTIDIISPKALKNTDTEIEHRASGSSPNSLENTANHNRNAQKTSNHKTRIELLPAANEIPKKASTIQVNKLEYTEKFIKGGGKGGQKVNKCSSRVQIHHLPTNTHVSTQRFRDLHSNRKEAMKLLVNKLDVLVNKDLSKEAIKTAKIKRKNYNKSRKAARKYGMPEDKK